MGSVLKSYSFEYFCFTYSWIRGKYGKYFVFIKQKKVVRGRRTKVSEHCTAEHKITAAYQNCITHAFYLLSSFLIWSVTWVISWKSRVLYYAIMPLHHGITFQYCGFEKYYKKGLDNAILKKCNPKGGT